MKSRGFVTLSPFSNYNNVKEFLEIDKRIGVRLRFISYEQHRSKSMGEIKSIGGLLRINAHKIPLYDINSRIMKRLFDIIFSMLAILFVFSWLFPILALVIKFDSKGPVFFFQKRTGINNKTFICYKFRTMQINDQADLKQATEHDSRITQVGNFLRRTYLDELPQFFNVLLGQMSVIGPRPHMLKHTIQYAGQIKNYLNRHYVKPGISGWAQVNGHLGETKELWQMEKRVECDIEYIKNWTFMWDMKIIWYTVFGKKKFENIKHYNNPIELISFTSSKKIIPLCTTRYKQLIQRILS